MADRIVQLVDENDNNIFPVASVANAANITMTDTDPGEGSPLAAGQYVAVYDQNKYIETADIADHAVTSDKIDFTTLPDNYSTSEVDTGRTWIDGKKIYRNIFTWNAGDITTGEQLLANIPGVYQILPDTTGTVRTNSGYQIPFPFYSSGSDYARTFLRGTQIFLLLGDIYRAGGASQAGGELVAYYTKSS